MQTRNLKITDKTGKCPNLFNMFRALNDHRLLQISLPQVLEKGYDLIVDAGADFGVSTVRSGIGLSLISVSVSPKP